jgi:2-keto-3-deoxy-L-rhamnonate aldolase RhmA
MKRFRDRLRAREGLLGTFIKTPTPHATEVLASLGYDFVIIDAEHAPFDRRDIDYIVMAARGCGIAALVRVPENTPAAILCCLDVGADGVLAPHVDSPERAAAVASACRYRDGGTRGYSTNSRAGHWGGTTMQAHIESEDARVSAIAMIEDAAALDRIGDIAAVAGIESLFIGRADLSVSLGQTRTDAPETTAAVERILDAARAADRAVMVLATSPADAAALRARGATAVVVSSDQGFLRSAAAEAIKQYKTSS